MYDDITDSGDDDCSNDESNDEYFHYNDDYDVSPIVAYPMPMQCEGVLVDWSCGDHSGDHSSVDKD